MIAVHSAPVLRVGLPSLPVELNRTVPSTRGFVRLLETFLATGGTAPGEVVGEMFRDHRRGDLVTLARLLVSRQIFSFGWRGSLWLPMFQFDPVDLSVAPGPEQARAELPAALDGWDVASWFAEPHAALGGRLPVEVVGTDRDAVRDAARATRRGLRA